MVAKWEQNSQHSWKKFYFLEWQSLACITISVPINPDIEAQHANTHTTLALFMHFQHEKQVL